MFPNGLKRENEKRNFLLSVLAFLQRMLDFGELRMSEDAEQVLPLRECDVLPWPYVFAPSPNTWVSSCHAHPAGTVCCCGRRLPAVQPPLRS